MSAEQKKIEFPEDPKEQLLSKDKAVIREVMYDLLAAHFLNRTELELELGDDLIDNIWQMPYEKLSPNLKKRYDAFIDNMMKKHGTPDQFVFFMYLGRGNKMNLEAEQVARLKQSLRNLENENN